MTPSELQRKLSSALEACLAFALLVIASVIVLQVVLSFVFNSSITGANELVTKLFVYTSTIGASLALGKHEHIQISVVVDRLPNGIRQLVDRLVVCLVGTMNLVLLVYSFRWIQVTGSFLMPTTQLPRIVVQISVPIGCGLALLFCVLQLCSSANPASPRDSAKSS